MMSQRVGVSALRRGAALRPTFFTQRVPQITAASLTPSRPLTTEKLSEQASTDELVAQRLRRPLSPHLSVYKPGQTWFTPSIWHRFTGAMLSGSLYAYCSAYAFAPLLGWHIESASMAAAFAAWPLVVKAGLKFLVAWPFTFHFANGIRHLFFDMAKGFQKDKLPTWGWVVWGSSLAAALGLVVFV